MEKKKMSENVPMRPRIGDSAVALPVSIDTRFGGIDRLKSNLIFGSSSLVFLFIAWVILLWNGSWMLRIWGTVVCYLLAWIIRLVVLKEHRIRKEQTRMIEKDFQVTESALWGIYEISSYQPYICKFSTGWKGVFLRLDPHVTSGKTLADRFDHYSSIANAFREAKNNNIRLTHLDVMQKRGSDARLEQLKNNLSTENPDLHDLWIEVFSNLQTQLSHSYATSDVVLLQFKGENREFIITLDKIISEFYDANFAQVVLLDREEIRDLCKELFNLESFSATRAMLSAFNSHHRSIVVPVSLTSADGTTKNLKPVVVNKETQKTVKTNKITDLEPEKRVDSGNMVEEEFFDLT